MTQQAPEIQLNTVGQIGGGTHAGWYIFVLPQNPPGFAESYTVYLCSDSTFAFEPGVREAFDNWVENMPSLEGLFEDRYLDITWHPEITPPTFAPSPRADQLAQRFRAQKAPKSNPPD